MAQEEKDFWHSVKPLEGQNWLTQNIRGEGYLEFEGHLRFSGFWKGSIVSKDKSAHLFFLKGSTMQGMVMVENLTVFGELNGVEIHVNSLHLLKGAKITGRVSAKILVVDEGAIIEGQIERLVSSPIS